jgi:high-affinity nickel-transport protein
MTITFVSVLVALLVGGIEVFGLVQDRFDLKGSFWDGIVALDDNFGMIGYLIIGIFVASWIISTVIYRARGFDRSESDMDGALSVVLPRTTVHNRPSRRVVPNAPSKPL